ETLRDEKYWPKSESKFGKESVGLVYMSPVDAATGMFGDIGFSFYRGENQVIRDHLKNAYASVMHVADAAQPGMRMKDLFGYAKNIFDHNHLKIAYMTT